MHWITQWFNGGILLKKTAEQKSISIPIGIPVGSEVTVWVEQFSENPNDPMVSVTGLPGRVVGLKLGQEGATSYDVAFPIGDTEFYSVVRDIKGKITRAGVTYEEAFGKILSAQQFKTVIHPPKVKPKRPELRLVPANLPESLDL